MWGITMKSKKMKLKTELKYKMKLIILLVCALISRSAFAELINSDFTNGYNGWHSDVTFYDVNSGSDIADLDIDFSNYTDNFVLASNSLTLNTSGDFDNEYWGLYAYQEFQVASNSSALSLELAHDADYVYVTLVDENFDLIHDFLSDGLIADLTAFSGMGVSLEFGIEDFYDDGIPLNENYLTISNVSISTVPVPVPEPSSFAIFALALVAIGRKSLSAKK